MSIKALVWGENLHEHSNAHVGRLYPDGMHQTIANALSADESIEATTATLQMPEHGLSEQTLKQTDVLLWWGHAAHDQVDDAIVERVQQRVWEGMGLIALHSAHFSKIFRRLMGTPCALTWREAGERERLWVIDRSHPITQGVGPCIELAQSEMYGEPFSVPEPDQTLFISWFEGGEVFRSGMTWQRGGGRIFYFGPGHETYAIYHDANVQKVLCNAVRWAAPSGRPWVGIDDAPQRPASEAPEPLTQKGPRLHSDDEQGFR